MSRRNSGLFIGIGSVVIVLLMIAIAYREPMERKIIKEWEEDEYRWFLKKPIRFMNLPNELKGELNYTFFPSGVCEQLPMYDSYDVRDISIANVQIMNSDIQNAYMHNATIQNCNIEDATFINSTIFNCWIGENVTFINCPPGSDPAAGMALSEFFYNTMYSIYSNVRNTYCYHLNNATILRNFMGSNLQPGVGNLAEYDLLFFSMEKINDTIVEFYNIHDFFDNSSYNYTLMDPYTMQITGQYVNDTSEVIYNISISIQTDGDINITKMSYTGDYVYNSSQMTSNHHISEENIYMTYFDSEISGQLQTFERSISGSNNSSHNEIYFNYGSRLLPINITLYNVSQDIDLISINYNSTDIVVNNSGNEIIWESIEDSNNIYLLSYICNDLSLDCFLNRETTTFDLYSWAIKDQNETVITHYMLKNGTFIDPHHKLIKREPYKKFGVIIGGYADIWYQLTPQNIKDISAFLFLWNSVNTAARILIMAKLAAILIGPTKVMMVFAIVLAIYWYWLYNYYRDSNNGDIEFRLSYKGYYVIGGTNFIYAYKDCSRGDNPEVQKLINPTTVTGIGLRFVMNHKW